MAPVPAVALPWLIELVNKYSPQTREAVGRQRDPYPDLSGRDDSPALPGVRSRDLAETAGRLWLVFGREDAAGRAAQLNRLLAESELTPRLDDGARLRWSTRHRGGRAILLAGCSATLLDAVQRHGWQRLGTCSRSGCVDVYVDLTGRGSRRYCCHTCLNRARVGAYRSRRHAPSRA
jgi:predicted RNA-binding Zn ribbon-like protein